MSFKVLVPQLGSRGLTGAQIIHGTEAPQPEQGNNDDFFIRYGPEGDTQIYGPKNDGAWGSGRSIRGGQGLPGLRGWNPVLLTVPASVEVAEGVFEARILVQLAAWIGGQGAAPTTYVGQYVNAAGNGYTEVETEALDLRGAPGIDGVMSGMEIVLDDDAAIGAVYKGKNVVVSSGSPVELTLDEAEILGAGWMATVINRGGGQVTLATTGEDEFDGPSVLGEGQAALLWVNAAQKGFRSQIWTSNLAPRVDIASAATTPLAAVLNGYARITGTTGISSFGDAPVGAVCDVLFEGSLDISPSADILLPGDGAGISTRPGDTALFRREATGWRCMRYSRAGGLPLLGIRNASIALTSGTAHVVSGIPSWARRIEINLSNIRKTGSAAVQLRIGSSSGLQDSGYLGGFGVLSATPSANAISNGIQLVTASASGRRHGKIILTCINFGAGIWSYHGCFWDTAATLGSVTIGTVVASGELDRVGLVALDGAFDGDSTSRFQVSYEG